jgi:two-component system, cell cycle response regulator
MTDRELAEEVVAMECQLCYQPLGDLADRWLADHALDADSALVQRVRLLVAWEGLNRGQVHESAAVMQEIRAWARERGDREVEARSERALGVLFRRISDPAATLEHSLAAVDLMPPGLPKLELDLRMGLADALNICGSYDESFKNYGMAFDLAGLIDRDEFRLLVLNNWAYGYVTAGRHEDALLTVQRLLALSHESGVVLQLYVVDTVAATYMETGRLIQARGLLRQALDQLPANAPQDEMAICLLRLAGVERLLGYPAAAARALLECQQICQRQVVAGIGTAVNAVREEAEQHAVAGRYKDAYETFGQFHERLLEMHSLERETRARAWQAIYQTDEARRESARFREMSYRDALTGLYNRRYVDEQLSQQLREAADASIPLTVAFIDLDHFKLVNDRCSHEIGDAVLRRVAVMLENRGHQFPGGFAARMGGEEFLVVLPGVDTAPAWKILESMRREIASTDWTDLTGGLPVTASFGSATMPDDGSERLRLLARADDQLYVAKSTGRNRVARRA